jgi:hypothetical protein
MDPHRAHHVRLVYSVDNKVHRTVRHVHQERIHHHKDSQHVSTVYLERLVTQLDYSHVINVRLEAINSYQVHQCAHNVHLVLLTISCNKPHVSHVSLVHTQQ